MELDEQLKLSRDRITEMLTNQRPSLGDISRSFVDAVTQRRPYGDVMNEMKAARLGEQKTLYDVLSGHKKIKQTDRQIDQTDAELAYKELKLATDKGNNDAKFIMDAVTKFAPNDEEAYKLAGWLKALPESVNADNVMALIPRGIEELGLKPKPVGEPKETWTYGDFVPSGSNEPVAARRSNTGKIELQGDNPGEWKSAPRGKFIGLSVQASSVGDLGPQKKEMVALREQRDIMTNLIKAANRLRGDLKEHGAGAIGWAGAIERFADTAIAQANALADRWGDDLKLNDMIKGIEWSSELAGQSAAIKSQIASMAYAIALMKNGSRPTDEDVRNALVIIGNSGSPDQMLAAIDSLMRESVDNYSTRHKTLTGEDWDAQAHFREYGVPVPGSEGGAKMEFINMSDEELEGIDLDNLKTFEEVRAFRKELERRGAEN